MNRDEAIARLKKHEAELRGLGVEHLYLFGSTARGDARQDSDVDLFFDHPRGELGMFRRTRPGASSTAIAPAASV